MESKGSSKGSVPVIEHKPLRLVFMAEGEEAAGKTAGDYQREAAEKNREYDSTASALEGKRGLNAEETTRLKQRWKKLVRMFHPDLPEHDPEKGKNSERG